MEASFFWRTALAGCSDMVMISVVTSAVARSCFAAKGVTNSSAPATSTSRSESASSAAATPSRRTEGSRSEPMTSTQTLVILSSAREGEDPRYEKKADPKGTGLPGLYADSRYSVVMTSRSL